MRRRERRRRHIQTCSCRAERPPDRAVSASPCSLSDSWQAAGARAAFCRNLVLSPASLRAIQRRSHNEPSRRKLILRALGQASQSEGIMENAAGRGVCLTYSTTECVGVNTGKRLLPVGKLLVLSRNRVNTQSWQGRILKGVTQRFFVRSYNLEKR